MDAFVTGMIIAAAMFTNTVVEVSAEITTDLFLDDDPGIVAEVVPEPRTDIVDLMPGASVMVWTRDLD